MTRAPAALAISVEPSAEPLSATITSPLMPAVRSALSALRTHPPTVSRSFRHGITTDNSGLSPADAISSKSAELDAGYWIVASIPTTVLPKIGCQRCNVAAV
jgi:hypothetical protein